MLFHGLAGRHVTPGRKRHGTRLAIETLEARAVPAATSAIVYTGPFFLERGNALLATIQTGQVVNTGGVGIALSVGKDLNGLPMAVLRDFNSRVYIFDQGTWIDTGGFAQDLVAGTNGEFFARDFNNLVYHYQLGAGWNVATSPGSGDPTKHFAIQLSLGQESVTNATGNTIVANVLYTRDPGNHLQVYHSAGVYSAAAGTFLPTFTDTGGFATDVAAGYHGEAFVRDGNSKLYLYNGSWTATGAWAFSLDVGTVNGNDYLAFKDANSQIYIYQPGTNSFLATGGWARQVAAAANDIYIRDFNDDVHYYNIATQSWIDVGHFASLIRVVNFNTTVDSNLGQVWGLSADRGNAMHAFFFGGVWTDLGFAAKDIQGFKGY